MIPAGLAALLASESTLVLSTVSEDGTAASAPLYYVHDPEPLRLYWLSSANSLHSRNLTDRRVAVVVFAPATSWREIRGCQMTGRAARVAKTPDLIARYKARLGLAADFDALIEESSLYCFRPDWIRYLDNSVRFGFKQEIELGE